MSDRLDLVLVGATGFTGGLTAHHLAESAPAGLRWGIAGRSEAKLARVRSELVARHPERPELAELPLLPADIADPAGLADLAAGTRVLATTVGPYLTHGEPLVRACAEAGTDYLDLSGEPEFVDLMYARHHRTAQASGARIVHACGFDSVPHDLGVRDAVTRLGATGAVEAYGVVRAKAMVSAGTYHSALDQFARPRAMRAAHAQRRRVEPAPAAGRRSRSVAGRPHRDRDLGYWLVPLPTIDPMVVAHSGRVLESYGSSFTYRHYAGTRTVRYAAGGALGVGALALAAQIGPVRDWLGRRMASGEGPDAAVREDSWFTVDVIAEGEGRRTHTRVSGGDPGYSETARMLGQSALCLALDDNPETAGCVTTAIAMGERLTDRLGQVGIRFDPVL